MTNDSDSQDSTQAAVEAVKRGWQPIPIRKGTKEPFISAWAHRRWDSPAEAEQAFTTWTEQGATNIGLLLGEPSGGLIDVDLDHPTAIRLRDHFLPPTPMRSGRTGRPLSHMWYRVEGTCPGTRRYKMPDGAVSVELRSKGSQTVIPPSVHPTGDYYRWEGEAWGGGAGPAIVNGRVLATQVALLALGAVLIENWPADGSRHDAYLALAGGLLRLGNGVHPFWEKNAAALIGALADATHDKDGAEARIRESLSSTLAKLRTGQNVVGLRRLGEMIGEDHAEQVRRMKREVESQAGFVAPSSTEPEVDFDEVEERLSENSALPPEARDPLGERDCSWQPVDLEPYISEEVQPPQPTILRRTDGKGLFYKGRVNSLYGQSEGAKTWIAMIACQQEIAAGERVMFIDLEDEPTYTVKRLKLLGCGDDDIRKQFTYVHPEEPLQAMQRNRWGQSTESDIGVKNQTYFQYAVDQIKPSLLVVDGMTALYGLHGLDTNDAASTDVIVTWLKKLTRNGATTVIVIDHTGKSASRGSSPIGAHHKIAMVQGTALQAHPIAQPMPGVRGEVELLVFKDRPGEVRQVSSKAQPAVAAIVILDSTKADADGSPITTTSVDPPDPDHVGLDAEQVQAMDDAARKLREKAEAAEREKAERASVAMLFMLGDRLDRQTVADTLDIPMKRAYEHLKALREEGVLDNTTGRGAVWFRAK